MTENNAAQPGLTDEEIEAVRRALEIYAECYVTMTRIAAREGREPVASPVSVAFDIRKNMVNAVVNALSKLRAEGVQAGDERGAFEAWVVERTVVKKYGAKLNTRADGSYGDYRINDRWLTWQARARLANTALADEGQSVLWENFPAYLIDHCEGDIVTEEGIQRALANMLDDPKYATALASAPVAGGIFCPCCGTHEVSVERTCHNSDCELYAQGVTMCEGWRPAAPQASEAVRKPITTLAEFCAEADRIGMTGHTLAALLAERPEFADCLPQADKDGGDCAKSAGDGQQKYWLCCGSKDPNHPNRRAPDCFNTDRARWGTADRHSAAQKQGDSDAG